MQEARAWKAGGGGSHQKPTSNTSCRMIGMTVHVENCFFGCWWFWLTNLVAVPCGS